MNEIQKDKPLSTIQLVSIMFVFLVVGISMFGWSILSAVEMLEEINANAKYITLNKTVYFLFGGGLFFIIMVLGAAVAKFVNDKFAKVYVKYYAMLLLASLALAFILPQVVHYFTERYAFENNYVVCEARSTQWLYIKTIVYTKSLPCN